MFLRKSVEQNLTPQHFAGRSTENWRDAYFYEFAHRFENLSPEAKIDRMFNILLIGDHRVGKSSFRSRFCDGNFYDNFISIGADFEIKKVGFKGSAVKLQIWEPSSGQECFRDDMTPYYRGAQAIFAMFDIGDQTTFGNLAEKWGPQIKRYTTEGTPVLVVGLKSDGPRAVAAAEGAAAAALGAAYAECSARSGEGVERAIFRLVRAPHDRPAAPTAETAARTAPRSARQCGVM